MASLQTDGRRCSLDSRNDETWFPTDVYNLFFCTGSTSPSQRELRHAPQHLPVSYLAGWRRGSTCWGWHQEMWLVIHQEKNNCRDYTSAAEREAICIFPLPFVFQWISWNLEEFVSLWVSWYCVKSSFAWQEGSSSPNDKQVERQEDK